MVGDHGLLEIGVKADDNSNIPTRGRFSLLLNQFRIIPSFTLFHLCFPIKIQKMDKQGLL